MDNVFQEIYYGKPKEFLKLEKKLDVLRKKSKGKIDNKPICRKMVTTIMNTFNKVFNFSNGSKFIIEYTKNFICQSWLPSDDNVYPKDINKFIKITNKGVRFTEAFAPEVVFEVSSLLLVDKEINSEMLLGALLHELGHSIEWKVRTYAYDIEKVNSTFAFLNKINLGGLVSQERLRSISKHLGTVLSNSTFDTYPSTGKYGKAMEQFCDQFATIYGYGNGLYKLLTWLEKMKYNWIREDNKNRTILAQHIAQVFSSTLDLLIDDPHPEYGERIKGAINQLQYELDTNKSLSKRERADLQKQIDTLNYNINEFLNSVNDDDPIELKAVRDKSYESIYKKNDGYDSSNIRTIGFDYLLNGSKR